MAIHRIGMDEIDMQHHIRQSNLIEQVDDQFEDRLSLEAWKWLVKQPRLSRQVVMQLHSMIMLGKLDVRELGQNRRVAVTVGGRATPDPYLAIHLLANWILDMRGWAKLDPKEMHIRFEHIHPFVDGNGRTGRMLMWWHEVKLGRKPTLISFDDRQDYYRWFDKESEK